MSGLFGRSNPSLSEELLMKWTGREGTPWKSSKVDRTPAGFRGGFGKEPNQRKAMTAKQRRDLAARERAKKTAGSENYASLVGERYRGG